MRLLMPSSETLIGATAKVIIFSTAVLRIGENGLIVMAIMIRNEDNKDYQVALIVPYFSARKKKKLMICLSSWLQLNQKGGLLPDYRLETCDPI